jgi:hypothetical protein
MKIRIETLPLDTSELRDKYKQLSELSGIKAKYKAEQQYLKETIKQIRSSIKDYGFLVYKVTATGGKHTYWQVFRDWPTASDIREVKSEMLAVLRRKRYDSKKVNKEQKSLLGYAYVTVAGTFTQANSILELQKQSNSMDRIRKPKKPSDSIKAHYIGVELELIAKVDRSTLNSILCDAGLAGYVYVKDDSSIHREKDEDYAHEVTILTKQQDASSIITSVCKVLNSERVGSYVNNSCGMHMHFDMRNRNAAKSYKNMVAILPVLNKLVPLNRIQGSHARQYCRQNDYNLSFTSAEQQGRYFAINAEAFSKYKTLESRMHGGTTNAAKILNWMSIILSAIECEETLTTEINSVEFFIQKFNINSKLAEYMMRRQDLFAKLKEGADTRSDHFYSNDYDIAV